MSKPLIISRARQALLAEVKCEFIKSLPCYLTIREKGERVGALNIACSEVLKMPVDRFDLEE